MPKTRKERRKASKAAYLAGRAKNPHRHTPVLRRSLEESCSAEPVSSTGVCPQCAPILSRYSETFKNLVHQGTELKRRKAINPHPKKPDTTHYRDVVQTICFPLRIFCFSPIPEGIFTLLACLYVIDTTCGRGHSFYLCVIIIIIN